MISIKSRQTFGIHPNQQRGGGQSGPRTKKGRRRYKASWKEPKLVIIYAVDDQGKIDRRFIPVIEGTLKGPDTAFGLLRYHLKQLGVRTAKQILFVADGARWIWNRISELLESLGLSGHKVYELVDFYHAVKHLAKVADFKVSIPTFSKCALPRFFAPSVGIREDPVTGSAHCVLIPYWAKAR